MSESANDASIYKLLTWILLAGLIGLYALYDWYQGTLSANIASGREEIAAVSGKLSEAEGRLQALTEKDQGLNAKIESLKADAGAAAKKAAAELEAAESKAQDLQDQLEAANGQTTKAKARNDDLTQQLEAAHGEIDSLKSKLEAASQAEADLKAAGEQAQAQIGELEGQIGELEKSVADAEAKTKTEVEAVRTELGKQVDLYRTALEGSEPDRAAQIAGLEDKVKGVMDDLGAKLAKAAADAESAAKDLAESQAANAELEKKAGALQGELEAERNATKALKDKHEQAKAGIDARDAKLAQAAQDADAAAKALADAQAAGTELQQKAAALQGELDDAKAQIEGRDTRLAQAALDADAAAKSLAELQAANTELQRQVAAFEEKVAGIQSALDGERKTSESLQQQLDQAKAQIQTRISDGEAAVAAVKAELAAAASKAADEKRALESRIGDADQRINKLQSDLKAAQAETAAVHAADQKEMSRMQALYDRFSALGGTKTDHGMLLSIGDEVLRFQSGMATLPRGDLPSLDHIAALLKDYPMLTARIEGHTDSYGPEEINLELSKARADAVREALIERGVAPERLAADGVGEARPIADNATAVGRRKNRRVEIYILQSGE